MDANEVRVIITPHNDGSTTVKVSMDVEMSYKTMLVGLESAKKQMMEVFTDYCEKNGIGSDEAIDTYNEIKVKTLHDDN